MEETVNLDDIFKVLKKNMLLILTMMFIGIGLSGIATFFFVTPKYTATAGLIAKPSDSAVNTENINSNLMMINTYRDLIQGTIVTEKAHEKLVKEHGFKGSTNEVKNMISVEQSQSSQMFSIVTHSASPKDAANVANVVADVFQEEVATITASNGITVVSPAEIPKYPVSPNKKANLVMGAVLGIVAGLGLTLLSGLLNRTVKSETFVTEQLQLPLLGSLPIVEDKELRRLARQQRQRLATGEVEMDELEDVNQETEIDGLDMDSRTFNDLRLSDTKETSSELEQSELITDEEGFLSRSQRRRL